MQSQACVRQTSLLQSRSRCATAQGIHPPPVTPNKKNRNSRHFWEHFIYARPCAKCFLCSISFNPCNENLRS